MKINLPNVKAEVEAAFASYEQAVVTNDAHTLDALFWNDQRAVRYGIAENLYGMEAIREFRRTQASVSLMRRLERTVITTFGDDFATASTLYTRDTMPGKVGRQMQTWVRLPEGWRIVAASVSWLAN
jgi:hypothetical protein